MFTGIVEALGRVQRHDHRSDGRRVLTVATPWGPGEVGPGDSVAVDGVCLTVTVVEPSGQLLCFDLSPETLARTTLGRRQPGDVVNLERALRVDGRLGGHLVLGHVDGVARCRWVRPAGAGLEAGFQAPGDLLALLAVKGCVALDGVSLTVAGLEPDGFWVALVPFTLERTTLGQLAPGREVNLEVDVLARYVARQLQPAGPAFSETGGQAF
ncbi:MAG TPA: riboflavin synthase [Limnochordales bacterium]